MTRSPAAIPLAALASVALLASCSAPKPRAPRIDPASGAGTARIEEIPADRAPETTPEVRPEASAVSDAETAPAPSAVAADPGPARAEATSGNAASAEPSDEPPPPRRATLAAGAIAPDFTLSDASGANPVALRSLRGRPTVLVFGSCTCPPFVRSTRATGALYQRYRSRVNFLMVYGREAHPTDGWVIEGNQFKVRQATTIDERRAAARAFAKEIGIEMPLVVDTIEGDAERLYDPFPNRLVVIDADGRIAHIGARGPQSTLSSAREVPAILDGLLGSR